MRKQTKTRARSGGSFTLVVVRAHVEIGRGGSAAFDHTWKYKPPSVSRNFRIKPRSVPYQKIRCPPCMTIDNYHTKYRKKYIDDRSIVGWHHMTIAVLWYTTYKTKRHMNKPTLRFMPLYLYVAYSFLRHHSLRASASVTSDSITSASTVLALMARITSMMSSSVTRFDASTSLRFS